MPQRRISPDYAIVRSGSVRQIHKLLFTKMSFPLPMLFRVCEGGKTLRRAGGELHIPAGGFAAVAGGQTFDVLNKPDEGSGIFCGEWIVFEQEQINAFCERHGLAGNLADIRPISDGTGLNEAFARLKAASETPIPQAAAQARLEEILAWLAEAGCVFAAHSEPDLTHRVRKMIAADTAKNWQENDMAAQFSMSVATFRRHLAQKNTGFRRLLADVRMMRALTLLQVSGKPVSQIAYEVGYQSPSRFTARFKERFGVLPSEVRSDGTIQSESGKSPFYSELK